jgi:acetylglutamate kinase
VKKKLYIVKIGGNIIDDERLLQQFLTNFSLLNEQKILIHGGGKLATRMAAQMGIEQTMVDGRRITDAETLKIVTMVYAGYINKQVVALLQSMDCQALGLCGADANTILAHKRTGKDIDYGFVGDVDKVNAAVLHQLIQQQIVPVLSPITHNGKGQLLNTNADTIAQETAKALSDQYEVELVYSFEKPGVLLDVANDDSVIQTLNPDTYQSLKAEGKIFAGMIPKLDNAFEALHAGVSKVVIGKAESLQLLVQGKTGTTIQL